MTISSHLIESVNSGITSYPLDATSPNITYRPIASGSAAAFTYLPTHSTYFSNEDFLSEDGSTLVRAEQGLNDVSLIISHSDDEWVTFTTTSMTDIISNAGQSFNSCGATCNSDGSVIVVLTGRAVQKSHDFFGFDDYIESCSVHITTFEKVGSGSSAYWVQVSHIAAPSVAYNFSGTVSYYPVALLSMDYISDGAGDTVMSVWSLSTAGSNNDGDLFIATQSVNFDGMGALTGTTNIYTGRYGDLGSEYKDGVLRFIKHKGIMLYQDRYSSGSYHDEIIMIRKNPATHGIDSDFSFSDTSYFPNTSTSAINSLGTISQSYSDSLNHIYQARYGFPSTARSTLQKYDLTTKTSVEWVVLDGSGDEVNMSILIPYDNGSKIITKMERTTGTNGGLTIGVISTTDANPLSSANYEYTEHLLECGKYKVNTTDFGVIYSDKLLCEVSIELSSAGDTQQLISVPYPVIAELPVLPPI